MKCWNCHHLNNASDAECFACGAVLYSGTPKAHGSLYVSVALCVFLPVFAVAGGTNKVLPYFGVTPFATQASGIKVRAGRIPFAASRIGTSGPILIPVILGVAGVSACLYITRTPFALKTQLILSALVVVVAWAAYLAFIVELAKEQSPAHHAPRTALTLPAS